MADMIMVQIYSKLEGDQLRQLVLRSTILADQQPYVRHLMVCLEVLYLPVMLHLGVMPLPLSPNAHNLSFVLASQCLHDSLCIERGANYFGLE
jgi:hypothetical protein